MVGLQFFREQVKHGLAVQLAAVSKSLWLGTRRGLINVARSVNRLA